jgi:PAS domain S-box-containing protein
LHRAFETLNRCSEALIRAVDEQMLLQELCDIAVEVGGFRMAWVGLTRDDDAKSIVPQAHAGVDADYLSEVEVTWNEDDPRGKGPAGQAVRTAKTVVVADLQQHHGFLSKEAADRRGFRSVVCLPLVDRGRTFGLFALYGAEERELPPEELAVLSRLAENGAYGVMALRARLQQQAVSAKLKEQASLLDLARDAIVVRRVDGTVTYWNQAAERLYGWSAAEMVGQPGRIVFEESQAFDAAMGALLEHGEWAGEFHQHTRDGKSIWVDARWTLLRDEAGQPASVLVINTDITERRRLEQQFLRAQRMESIGTLAGGIAHDLNNVLTPIMMAVDLLKAGESNPEKLELLELLEANTARGADMVRQVLMFARGVDGRRIRVDLADVLSTAAKIADETFLKTIEVRASLGEGLWPVLGDPTQIHQVVMNLLVNARDAMPNGGRLTITARNTEVDAAYAALTPDATAGPFVQIAVEDTGHGMPPEIVEKIFEPFFTTKEPGRGTGLGLSTSAAIIRSHGGFIRVYSEPGRGTTFRVHLPAASGDPIADAMSDAESLPRGQNELILVIDDEASVRHVTSETLRAFGYRVVTAADGADGVAAYAQRQEEVAAVIVDMMMPVMDGAATIRVLQRMNPAVRCLAASGLPNNAQLARLSAESPVAFLSKPYTARHLLVGLDELLRRG